MSISFGYTLIYSIMFIAGLLDIPKDTEHYEAFLSFGIGIPISTLFQGLLLMADTRGVDRTITRSWPFFLAMYTSSTFFVSVICIFMYQGIQFQLLSLASYLYLGRLCLLGLLIPFIPCSSCLRDFFTFPSN